MAGLMTVKVPNLDGIAKDEVEWGFAFAETPGGGTVDADMQSWATDFFTHDYGTGQLAGYLSQCLDFAHVQINHYDITAHLNGSPHGSPIFSGLVDWSASGGSQTASGNQLSAVLAYQATAYGSYPVEGPSGAIPTPESAQDMGAPATHTGLTKLRQRKAGRVYLGPLNGNAITHDANHNPKLTANAQNSFKAAAVNGESGGAHAHGLTWSVWSRRNASLDAITEGWVDQCIHTRRRRAFQDNTRLTY